MSEFLSSKRILVKSGGMGLQMSKHVNGAKVDGHPLWITRFDAENPKAVEQTQLDFLQNGAQIILSNTYQASIEGFMKHLNLSREESIALIRKCVQHAKEAKAKYIEMVQQANGSVEAGFPIIMAEIGPYGAHLNDGSEYTGNYAKSVSREEIQRWHRPRIEVCLAEGVDGLGVETIPCQMEADAIVDLILQEHPNVKFWISFQCQTETSLANGDNFAQAVLSIWNKIIKQNAKECCIAIGVNCLNPKLVTPLLRSVRDALPESTPMPPFIVYSNTGEVFDLSSYEWTGLEACKPLEQYLPEWISFGARIVGGCCRVTPNDIKRIRDYVDSIQTIN